MAISETKGQGWRAISVLDAYARKHPLKKTGQSDPQEDYVMDKQTAAS